MDGVNIEAAKELTYEERAAALKDATLDEKLNSITGANKLKEMWTKGLRETLDDKSYPGVLRTESDKVVTIILPDALPNEPRDATFYEYFCRVLDIVHVGTDGSRSLPVLGRLNAFPEESNFKCSTKIEGVTADIHYQKPKYGNYGTNLSLSLNINR
jgi:hypothetical protein